MRMRDGELLEAAADLARQAGRAPPLRLDALKGGNNNRVFRVDRADGEPLVLKSYFSDPRDPRDRLGAEWSFVTYAWQRGVRTVPEALAHDKTRHLGLYGWLPGRKLAAGAVTAEHVAAAMDFIVAVNGPPREPLALAPGSEACFSLAQHAGTVERRVLRLAVIDEGTPHRHEAETLIRDALVPAWHRVRARFEAETRSSPELAADLSPADLVVSPSDFGFHNALVHGGRIGFLDFEYAGRDDPAKLVCDFFCQPEVPVSTAFFPQALARLVDGLGLAERDVQRTALLLDLYRIKWACIILNPFLPVGAARRAFARTEEHAERCAAQLARAEAKLAELGT